MDNCGRSILSIGDTFARKIKRLPLEETTFAVDSLISELKASHNVGNTFNTESVARFIRSAVAVKSSKVGKLFRLDTIKEVEQFAINNPAENAEDNLAKLSSIPGFETLDEIIKTLDNKTVIIKAVLQSDQGNLKQEEFVTVSTSGGQIEVDFIDPKDNMFIAGKTSMQRQKSIRKTRTKELVTDSAPRWAAFMDVFFPGASGLGVEFTEHARTVLEKAIVDFSAPGKGFTTDINNQLQLIKQAVAATARSLASNSYSRKTISLTEELDRDTGVKARYFEEILNLEFDFIVESLLGVVRISKEGTDILNDVVSGFSYANGETLDSVTLNLNRIRKKFVVDPDDSDVLLPDFEGAMITKVPDDTIDFRRDKTYPNDAFYFLESDGEYYYRNTKGANINITPTVAYEYNITDNARSTWADTDLDSTDFAAGLTNNVFPMLRIIKYNTKGEKEYGRRLDKNDFAALATRLVTAGNDYKTFLNTLVNLSTGNNTQVSSVAHTVLLHIFEEMPRKGIYSIRTASRLDQSKKGMNTMVTTALYNSLTNHYYKRYMMWNEGVISVSRDLGDKTNDDTVNNGLARFITDTGYTKPFISKLLKVQGRDVYYKDAEGKFFNIANLAKVNESTLNTPSVSDVAFRFGLSNLFITLTREFVTTYPDTKSAEAAVHSLFIKIFYTAAANKKSNAYVAKRDKKVIQHPDYIQTVPSHFIKGKLLDDLANAFNADAHKALTTGGGKVPSTGPPNRDAYLSTQVLDYIKGLEYADAPMYYHPFITNSNVAEDSNIVKAELGAVVIKTDILHDGNVIKKSEWDEKIRVKHAMVTGFTRGVKNIGQEFLLQPVNYSDKNTPQLLQMFVNENLLADNEEMHYKLKLAYIEYQYSKNENLQDMMISSLKRFIVSDFSRLNRWIETDGREVGQTARQIKIRKNRLADLKKKLLFNDYPTEGDMTRGINVLLEKIGLDADAVKFSNADLDHEADYVTLGDGKVILKPNLGIRAELYRSPNALISLNRALDTHRRKVVDELGITHSEIKEELRFGKYVKKGDIVQDVDAFLDRFYLINGIYGHAMKTLTMGDESYFPGIYRDAVTKKNIKSSTDYYNRIDTKRRAVEEGKKNSTFLYGLEESESMLNAQFKRAQSELSEGISYIQQLTVQGLKRTSRKNDLLQHINVKTTLIKEADGSFTEVKSYDFASLEGTPFDESEGMTFDEIGGMTFDELEGLGVIERTETNDPNVAGALYRVNPSSHVVVILKVGNEDVTVSSDPATVDILAKELGNKALAEALVSFVATVNKRTSASPYSDSTDSSESSVEILPSVFTYAATEASLSLAKINEIEAEMRRNPMVTMPDLIPSILLSDPISYVNLVNKMHIEQENSDAVQVIHPVMTLIQDLARGGKLGVFTTKNQEAMKFITTTFEYDKGRQSLQKKSVQNPFTYEQFRKLGNVRLYNMLKTMNTAIDFPQTNMKVRVLDSLGLEKFELVEFKNMQELFEHFGGFNGKNDKVWENVLDVLIDNPANLYSFVGLVSLPSLQKTGRKKMNRYNDYFNNKNNTVKPHVDYTANEFNFEILSKEHAVDVSGKLRDKSVIALLSQLASAVAYGGLSNNETKNLQRSMRGITEMNMVGIGDTFAKLAIEIDPTAVKVINRLRRGDLSTGGTFDKTLQKMEPEYSQHEIELYKKTIRKGIYDVSQLAFDEKLDSEILKEILEDDSLSIDSPGVKRKIMNTLHASFFTRAIKMKMSGFSGTVSMVHNAISVFDAPSGRRTGRYGYIKNVLETGRGTKVTTENVDDFNELVLPVDDVYVYDKMDAEPGEISYTIRAAGSIDVDTLIKNNVLVEMALTPDVTTRSSIEVSEYDSLSDNTFIRVSGKNNKSAVYYKWYFDKYIITDVAVRNNLLRKHLIEKDLSEEFSLRWYEYSRDIEETVASTVVGDPAIVQKKTITLKDTDAYRNFYIESVKGRDADEAVLKGLRALLVVETQKKKENGDDLWGISLPEVVLPTFMRRAYNIPPGTSLIDIIGTSGDKALNAASFFRRNLKTGKTFKLLNNDVFFLEKTRRIYARKVTGDHSSFDTEVLTLLDSIVTNAVARAHASSGTTGDYSDLTDQQKIKVNDIQLDYSTKKQINTIIESAKEVYINVMAENFMETLYTVLTRIPGQSKQSGFAAELIEFLDSQGNATFASTSHLSNTGGDMDIDTLSVLTKAIDEKGIIYDAKDYMEDGLFVFGKMVSAYYYEVDTDRASLKKQIADSNESSARLVEIREIEIREIERKAKESSQLPEPGRIKELKLKLQNAKSNHITAEQEAELIDYNSKRLFKKYLNILSNVAGNSIFKALSNVATSVEVNTPVSMAMFGPIMERLASYKESKGASLVSGEDYGAIFLYEQLAAQGKESISIFATVLKITSGIQYAHMNYNEFHAGDAERDIDNEPFIFSHFLRYKSKLEGKNVVKARTSFADADRFDVMRRVSRDSKLQNALFNSSKGAEFYDSESAHLIVDTIEGEMKTALKNRKTKRLGLSPTTAGVLASFYGMEEGNELINMVIEDLNSGNIKQVLVEDLRSVAGIRLDTKEERDIFKRSLLSSLVDARSREDMIVFASKARDIFGINLPLEVIEGEDSLNLLREFLLENPDIAADGLKHLIGAQLSNDVQSQFLSAATDNAKELILGRIGSNTVTNPVMTTMMVLGYSADIIIDFLFDPDIMSIVNAALAKKGDLKLANLTASFVEGLTSIEGDSKDSLIELLKIGDNINAFRGVRNLNENAKVEQSKLLNILRPLGDEDTLFLSILKNDMRELKNSTNAKQAKIDAIFNPRIMTFLHDQAAPIYLQIHMTENGLFPAISHNSAIKRIIAGDINNNEVAHMNINNYLSGKVVDSFLNTKLKVKGEDRYRTGSIINDNKEEEFIELNTPANRERFVAGFDSYYEYAQTIIENNSAFNAMVYGRTYKSTGAVLGIPKLKSTNKDNIDIANIIQGLEELKTLTGNPTVDAIRRKIYNNFSHYALIVSMGEVKKGTMFEIFKEINKELAAHVNTITLEEWQSFVPTNDSVVNLVKGIIPTTEQIEQGSFNRLKKQGYGDIEGLENMNEELDGVNEFLEEPGDDGLDEQMSDEEFTYSRIFYNNYGIVDSDVSTPIITSHVLANNIFRIPNKYIADAVFYGYKTKEPAFRIFPSASIEATPHSSIPSTLRFPGMNADDGIFLKELTDAGFQIGLNAMYGKKKVIIFAYNGTKTYPNEKKYGMYKVLLDNEMVLIPEVHLREDNSDLNLRGNIMRPLKSTDHAAYDKYSERLKKLPIIPKKAFPVKESGSYETHVADYYAKSIEIQNEFEASKVAAAEASIIGVADVLLPTTPIIGGDVSYDMYKSNPDIQTSTPGTRHTLVPSILNTISKSDAIEKDVNIMRADILKNINNLMLGESTTFYGWLHDDGKYSGGTNIVIDLFRGLYNNKTKSTFMNDSFTITTSRETDMDGLAITKITRKNNSARLLLLGGRVLPYYLAQNEEGDFSTDTDHEHAVRHNVTDAGLLQIGLYNTYTGVYNNSFKEISVEINNEIKTVIEVAGVQYVHHTDNKGHEGFYKLYATNKGDNQFITNRSRDAYGLPKDIFIQIKQEFSKTNPINKC